MLAKRLFVIGLSLVMGVLLTFGIFFLLQEVILGGTTTPVTVATYGGFNFALTVIFLAAAVLVWLDAIFRTGMLPR
jgi:hypothetical protein